MSGELRTAEQAERALVQALARARQLELPSTEAYALLNLGHSLTMQDRFAEAEARLGEAEAIGLARGLAQVTMTVSVYRANLLCRAGRWTASRAAAERGAALAAEGEARSIEALALSYASRASLASGDKEAAIAFSDRAYALWSEVGSLEEGEGDLFLARMHALEAAGRRDEAAKVREQGMHRLEALAIRILDPKWRTRFLRHVESHAALLGS